MISFAQQQKEGTQLSIDKSFFFSFSYLIFFDKSDESRTFNLDRLSGAVVQSDDKMKKIRFTQVAGRLLFKMGATDSKPLREKKKMVNKQTIINTHTHAHNQGNAEQVLSIKRLLLFNF